MAEPSTPCRWGAMSVLMRLKNKIKEKVFWYRILNEPSSPDASESDPSNWTDSQHFDNEGSTSNHPDLQHYFDAPQGFQNPSSQFANLGQNGGLFSQMLHGEGMMLDPLDGSGTSHEQEAFMTLADFDTEDRQQQWTAQMYHRYTTSQYAMAEEYIDARAEMLDDQSSLQHSYSAPPQLGHLLSTVETAEMMDTGDSSNLGPVRQTSAVEWQRILFLQQFLGVDGAVRAGPGWKVVLGIVSAFKRLSGLIRRRRQEKTAEGPTPLATPRRIRSAEITKFKGIRPRKNGKWVSEIRIGGTLEKVWLGSYNTEKEAALAFDAGKHHCSLKRSAKGFNFSDSPRLLGPPQNFAHLSSVERRTRIQRLAEDHARAYASADIR